MMLTPSGYSGKTREQYNPGEDTLDDSSRMRLLWSPAQQQACAMPPPHVKNSPGLSGPRSHGLNPTLLAVPMHRIPRRFFNRPRLQTKLGKGLRGIEVHGAFC